MPTTYVEELPEEEQDATAPVGREFLEEVDADEPSELEITEDDDQFYDEITKRILLFTEEFTGISLFPYQREVAYRLIYSVIANDGSEITLLTARQSGKTELLANVAAALMVILPLLAKAYTKRLGRFDRGFMVGVFGPVDEQSINLHARIVDRLTSERATEWMLDPEINDRVDPKNRGKLLRLKNSGSLARRQTAHATAKIEGTSYHLVLIDECQDADDYVVRKSIKPMLAFYNGTTVLAGTPNRQKGYFWRAIHTNRRFDARRRNHRKNHFQYDYKTVIRYNHDYKRYIATQKQRYGEESDEFQMSYCVAPGTRILTADLRHVPAGDVVPGMRLVGFDEERQGKGQHRNFQSTEVLAVGRIWRPCYRLTFEDGTVVTCSAEHRWLVSTAGRRTQWKRAKWLTGDDRVFKLSSVWGPPERTYEAGYLAAAFEGEGCVTNVRNGQVMVNFSQLDNVMLQQVRKHLSEAGYTSWERVQPGGVVTLHIAGGRAEVLRFLGQVRPQRLLDKLDVNRWGSIGRHDRQQGGFDHPRLVAKEFVGEQEVVAIKTTTKTYVAEGLASHNCCRWLLERGMFVDEDDFEALGDRSMETFRSWWDTPLVVGIDPARTKDSTVVTVMYVDWDNVDPFGFYPVRVLNWLELHNEDWESQYQQIWEFLSYYNVWRIAVDSTGMGDAVADRLKVMFAVRNVEVVPMPGHSSEQSKRWIHMLELIQRKLFRYPARSDVRKTRKYKRFFTQMTDLQKKYQGPYLMAEAPNEPEAHDDYPDAAALACYLTVEDTVMPEVEVTESPFMGRSR